jgi:WW domain-containing oxidoreductase
MFNSWSTANFILHDKNLSGKVALITGCSSMGIGLETAKSLTSSGCEIIFACRNRETTLKAIDEIERGKEHGKMNFIRVDLASLKSCVAFCEEVKRQYVHIDYLILNAGVFGIPYTLTEDGLEMTFQVCHLSHFYIATSLADLLDSDSRVIVLASESHRFSNYPATGLTRSMLSVKSSRYWIVHAYNNAKLLNVIFALELSRRWQSRGISVFAVHPGNLVWTEIHRHSWMIRLLFTIAYPFTKSLQQAAATTVYCTTAQELSGLSGKYLSNCSVCEPSRLAQSEKLAGDLWELSETMIKAILG